MKNTRSISLLLVLCLASLGTAPALAQTAPLNDTGQSYCTQSPYPGSGTTVACDDAMYAGNGGSFPHQDGRYGRDAAATAGRLVKVGGGAAGFDFTRLCWNGAAEGSAQCTGTLVANTSGSPSGSPATDWACTRDNVTGRVWSLQTLGRLNYAAAQASHANDNTQARCGYTDWRMPTRRELLNVVHNGTAHPAIDGNYFPGTQNAAYWSNNTDSKVSNVCNGSRTCTVQLGLTVEFDTGGIDDPEQTTGQFLRLVR